MKKMKEMKQMDGSGWHDESVRHSNAKKLGHAGGQYHEGPKTVKMQGLDVPISYYDSSTGYPEPTAPPKEKKKEEKIPEPRSEEYNGWTNWDTWNTMLLLENTQASDRWLDAWHKNFKRKIKSGKFDREKAKLVVKKYLVPTARGKGSFYKQFEKDGFTADPEINPDKVNADEIVDAIINKEE